jgi:hypothetical protein
LSFGEKQLEDAFCLSDYDIKNNATLHLTFRLFGGSEKDELAMELLWWFMGLVIGF